MNISTVELDTRAINIALAEKQIGRKKICEKAAINESNFSSMMRRGTVRTSTAGRIAAALGVPVSEIIKASKEEN